MLRKCNQSIYFIHVPSFTCNLPNVSDFLALCLGSHNINTMQYMPSTFMNSANTATNCSVNGLTFIHDMHWISFHVDILVGYWLKKKPHFIQSTSYTTNRLIVTE